MMKSNAGDDFDEDFPPNPFRSTMTGEVPQQQQQQPSSYGVQQELQQQQGDFFQPYGTPVVTDPLSLQQQQQQPVYTNTAGMLYSTAQPYPPQMQQQQQMGMYPTQPAQIMQPSPYLQQPSVVVGGRMDNKMEVTAANSNGSATNAATPTSAAASTTAGRFGGGPLGWLASCFACCTMDTYKSYFDLDTEDIKTRIKAAVTSFYKADFFRNEVLGVGERTETLKGPDLYGPFWITMTLIFVVAVREIYVMGRVL